MLFVLCLLSRMRTTRTSCVSSSCCLLSSGFVALSLVAAPHAAHAQVTAYNSLTSFNAAATTSTVFDFNSVHAGTLNPSLAPLTVTITNIGFAGTGSGTDYAVYPANSVANNTLNGTQFLQGPYEDVNGSIQRTTTFGFGAGTTYTAFGTEFGYRLGDSSVSGTLAVQLFNGATAVGTPLNFTIGTANTFIGLTSVQAFNRITFKTLTQTDDADQAYDNVRVGSIGAAAATPEPGSIALLALSGLPVVGTIARQRRSIG